MVVPTWAAAEERATRTVPGRGTRVGTVAAIYGANASGKSSVLWALASMAQAVEGSHQRWTPDGGAPHQPFLFDTEHPKLPTVFEVDLALSDQRWQYGFGLDSVGVASEWLYSYPLGKRRVWFERDRDKGFYVGKSLTGQVNILRGLMRPNSLFLSVGAANNHPELSLIANSFTSDVRLCTAADQPMRYAFTTKGLADERVGPRIQALIRLADVGIVRAESQVDPAHDEERSKLDQAMSILVGEAGTETSRAIFSLFDVLFYHGGADGPVPLPLGSESQGTQAWYALAGAVVSALEQGQLLLIDEIDSSLHPHVAARLIKLFRDPATNKNGAQLVFTSHDTSLLGGVSEPSVMRDELWLTEKGSDGATKLYPLTDFHPRRVENVERGYLNGRYGGVPILQEDAARVLTT